MEPVAVSRPLLFGLVAVGAVAAVVAPAPTSSFGAGFAAGAGAAFVISFMKGAARDRSAGPPSAGEKDEP